MDKVLSNLHNILLVLLLVIVLIYRKHIIKNVPSLTFLFTDQVSLILLMIGCLLLVVVDVVSGILVSTIVIILGLSVKSKSRFSDTLNLDMKYRSDSEFYYNPKFVPNGNLPPFKPTENTNKGLIPVNSNEASSKSCLEPDFIERVGPLNRDGYDVEGCRYDFKDSPQNLTIYGPPLAHCSSNNSFACTGTVFYPLNE